MVEEVEEEGKGEGQHSMPGIMCCRYMHTHGTSWTEYLSQRTLSLLLNIVRNREKLSFDAASHNF